MNYIRIDPFYQIIMPLKGELLANELFRLNRFSRHVADKIGWLAWRVQLDEPEAHAGRVRELYEHIRENRPIDLTPEMQYAWSFDKCEYMTLAWHIVAGPWMPSWPSKPKKKQF